MPIYEYSCQDCGTRFEKLVRTSAEKDGLACPSCGEPRLRQELSVFAAHAHAAPGKGPQPPAGGPCAGCRTPEACGFGG
jgi:putative FmdB family regulatory protein